MYIKDLKGRPFFSYNSSLRTDIIFILVASVNMYIFVTHMCISVADLGYFFNNLSQIPEPEPIFLHPGSRFPDPRVKKALDPGSRIRNMHEITKNQVFLTQTIVTKLLEYDSGCASRTDFFPCRIPDPGAEKTGSRIPDLVYTFIIYV